jgi:hypothetical protein
MMSGGALHSYLVAEIFACRWRTARCCCIACRGEVNTVPLNIRNPETERLAEMLAQLTGESKTEAVTKALRDRLARVRR